MLTKFSIKKPFTVLVAVIITIVFGCVAFTRMTPDLFPKFDLPYVAVVTTYPGASSHEVEKTVTEPMEQQLASLENLKSISSSSQENASMVFLEFEQETKLDTISVDIRDKIELASSKWSDTVQKPLILKMNPSMVPIAVAAVSQKGKDINETSAILEEELLRKLEGIEGVASVSTTGMVENTIHITLDENKIKNVNKKISDNISAGFGNAKKQINNQIENAQKGVEQINKGKTNIKVTQDTLINQGSMVKQLLVTLKTLNTTKEGLQLANREIKEQIKSKLPTNITEEQLEKACMANKLYAQNKEAIKAADKGINKIINQLKPMASNLKAMDIKINDLRSLNGVIKAESDFNKNLDKAKNKLGNSMSELTGNEALLNSANMQLKGALSQISQQESTAKKSGDVSEYLNISSISNLIMAQDFQMPAGFVSDDNKDVLVSVGDKIKSARELQNMIILDMGIDGVKPIKLSDVANITYLSNGEDNYSKINGEDGILLMFNKQSDHATTEVSDNITKKFDELSKSYDGLKFDVLSDQGDYIHMAIDSVLNNLLIGGILAILILLYFLKDIRPTIVTAISIPISITFAIVLMYFSNISLNIVSLAGLAVGVGMLVDNSIVVIENIYRLRILGYSKIKAALSGAVQVAGAITASTLTTVCVFVPIVFIDGMTKVVFKDMALTVTYSLFASLIVALTVVPTLSSVVIDKTKNNTVLNNDSKVIKFYRKIVNSAIDHKVIVLIVVVLLLLSSVTVSLMRGFEYMPSMATPQISATIKMPDKSTKEETMKIGDKMAESLDQMEGVKTVGVTLSSNMASMMGISGGADFSSISLYILMDEDKLDKGAAVTEKIVKLSKQSNCEASVSGSADMMAMMGGSGISINIESDNLDDVRESSLEVENLMRNTKGLSEVSDVSEQSTEEIKISVDKDKAMKYNLTVAQVYAQITDKISTEKVATSISYKSGNKDVVVSNKGEKRVTKNALLNMKLKSGNNSGKSVLLRDICTVKKSSTFSVISRINQKRGQTVSAKVDDGYNVTKQTSHLKKEIKKLDLPKGVEVEFRGEDEQIKDAMNQLVKMFVLGFLLVYLIMVAQFQSLLSPFIVMFTVPLAVTGALIALLITGFELSVISMIGIVVLMGIIVNNAIVLVDYINQMRQEGMSKREAIVEAGAVRMRPVLMTAITTILGLLPLALGIGKGAEMMQPVAIVCIGGLIYATIMTLIVIPIMYDILVRKNIRKISREELTITEA